MSTTARTPSQMHTASLGLVIENAIKRYDPHGTVETWRTTSLDDATIVVAWRGRHWTVKLHLDSSPEGVGS